MMFGKKLYGSHNNIFTMILVFLMVAASGALTISILTHGHDWGGDFAQYIMQADSIVNRSIGEFMQANRFAMEESSYAVGPVAYPWGLPLYLAPFYAFWGNNLLALKIATAALYLPFLLFLWFGFRTDHNRPWRFVLLLLFAVNPDMLTFMNAIFADIPFLLFSTAAILLLRFLFIDKKQLLHPVIDGALLGIIIAVASFIRNNGILLLFTLAAIHMIQFVIKKRSQKRHKQTKVQIPSRPLDIAPYIAFGILLFTWRMIFPEGGGSHIDLLREISPALIYGNLQYYFRLPAEFFMGTGRQAAFMIYIVSLPLAGWGILRRFRRDYPLVIYCILTLTLYVVWPSRQGLRFLFPVLPFYISFMLTGLAALPELMHSSTSRKAAKGLCIIPIVLIILIMTWQSFLTARFNLKHHRLPPPGPYSPDAQDLFSHIRMSGTMFQEGDTIIFFKPRVMRLMTGRSSILINEPENLPEGDFLCVHPAPDPDQILPEALIRMVEKGMLRLIYQNNTFSLYEICK